MSRRTRYQGAIVRNGQILVIAHRIHRSGQEYWLLPGGGIEPGETEEQCVVREMREETGLTVRVERWLLTVPDLLASSIYEELKTYLCTPVGGQAQPGHEPEPSAAGTYAISQVRWLPIYDESQWWQGVTADPHTYGQLRSIQRALRHGDRKT